MGEDCFWAQVFFEKVSSLREGGVLRTEQDVANYGHENEMYNVGVNLKEREGLKMRELRVDWEKMGDKTKCAKG